MPVYSSLLKSELEAEYQKELLHYENCKKQNLDLNMARGKPSTQQLDHVSEILKQPDQFASRQQTCSDSPAFFAKLGKLDCRVSVYQVQ